MSVVIKRITAPDAAWSSQAVGMTGTEQVAIRGSDTVRRATAHGAGRDGPSHQSRRHHPICDLVYVSFQNNAGKGGARAGSFSTIAAYQADTGDLVTTYQVTGRCDGLTADPTHHRLLASVNEDNNSSLFVIRTACTPPSRRCVNCC